MRAVTDAVVIQLMRDLAEIVVMLSGPLLMVGLIAGLLVSVIQVVTSIQDPTLSFVPRILVVMAAAFLLLSWMLKKITAYTVALFSQLATYAQ